MYSKYNLFSLISACFPNQLEPSPPISHHFWVFKAVCLSPNHQILSILPLGILGICFHLPTQTVTVWFWPFFFCGWTLKFTYWSSTVCRVLFWGYNSDHTEDLFFMEPKFLWENRKLRKKEKKKLNSTLSFKYVSYSDQPKELCSGRPCSFHPDSG